MNLVICIPTYNEVGNLEKLIRAIAEQRAKISVAVDVLFIDDNSPDGTGELANRISQQQEWVKVLHREIKNGIGNAYKEGFRWALNNKYDFIMQMDADLSHDPNALPNFIKMIQYNDAVFGSRYLHGVRVSNWSFKRLLLSKLSNEFIRRLLGIYVTDTTTAYKCFRRCVLENVPFEHFKGKQNAFLIELVHWSVKSCFHTVEIPFMFIERESGESKMNFGSAWESLCVTFSLLFRPVHIKQLKRDLKL